MIALRRLSRTSCVPRVVVCAEASTWFVHDVVSQFATETYYDVLEVQSGYREEVFLSLDRCNQTNLRLHVAGSREIQRQQTVERKDAQSSFIELSAVVEDDAKHVA